MSDKASNGAVSEAFFEPSNPPCLSRNTVFMRVCGPAKSKVTKKVTKVTRKIQKGKAVDLCARGIAPCFFNLTSIEYRYTI